jgi:hypothetical protein
MESSKRNLKRAGRILRLKKGFNPNSSSVGSEIPYFFATALISGALTVMVMNLMTYYDRRIRHRRDELEK